MSIFFKNNVVISRVMIYDINQKNWTPGPSLIFERSHFACMVDQYTETIHVMGGWDGSSDMYSTETLKKGSEKWEMCSSVKELIDRPRAVSSRSVEYVGYLVGGQAPNSKGEYVPAKTWGLRRHDMEWIELSKHLKTPRERHSIVNVKLGEIDC